MIQGYRDNISAAHTDMEIVIIFTSYNSKIVLCIDLLQSHFAKLINLIK